MPDETTPPETFPVDTSPIDTSTHRHRSCSPTTRWCCRSSDLVPLGDYTFADAPTDSIVGFNDLLDLSSIVAGQSGQISGVDVFDLDGLLMGRVFAFESDVDPLTAGSLDEVRPFLTGDIPTTPLTVGTQSGETWSDPDGTTYFLLGSSNVLLWALSPTTDLLVPALQAWGESVSQ